MQKKVHREHKVHRLITFQPPHSARPPQLHVSLSSPRPLRTLDSKREMDLLDALDEMRSLRARHAGVTTEQALAALAREAQGGEDGEGVEGAGVQGEGELPDEDVEAMREFMAQKRSILSKRIESDEDEEEDGQQQRKGAREGSAGARAGPSGSAGVEVGGQQRQQAGKAVAAVGGRVAPAVKLLVKPKRKVQGEGGDAKRQKQQEEERQEKGDSDGSGGGGGGLAGLLGDYGSGSGEESA